MRTIETTAIVGADGTLTVQAPGVDAGQYRVVVVIDEQQPVGNGVKKPLRLSAYPVGLASDEISFRREDLYDEEH